MTIKINGDNSVANPGFTGADTDTGLQVGTDELKLVTGGTARATVDSSGNVGIGASSPDGTLHVQGTNSGATLEALVLRNNATASDTATALRFTNSTAAYNHASIVGTRNGGGTLDFYTAASASAAMRIDSSGKVGIGTESPSTDGILTVSDARSATSYVTFENTQNYGWGVGIKFRMPLVNNGSAVNSGRIISGWTANDKSYMAFKNYNGSEFERMRLTSDGVIKLSNNETFASLTGNYNEINYSGNSASLILYARSSSTPYGYFYQSTNADPNNTSNYVFRAIQNTGVNIYSIWSNGTVSARSDARYKKNIETTRDGYLEDLSQLRVVKYNWHNHEDDAPKELGLVAQEVEQVFPGLVLNEPEQDAEGNDTGEVCKSIKFSVFTPMLIKGLQEAYAKIKALETQNADLTARITALETA